MNSSFKPQTLQIGWIPAAWPQVASTITSSKSWGNLFPTSTTDFSSPHTEQAIPTLAGAVHVASITVSI